ncbi:MAG: glutathione S-transferase [Acinetobacter populi]|jgi:glutathione S-transferase|uniref:glutathione S-transferase family protein n=1 Tax=Acinetobacter populi TaxID=1582270 RepID=UPI002357094C|nr:glutathione S-transferase [Acinetobacter populi]MCH4247175.1 glutathione S-transferase [Acinetobacter populi]
MQQKKLILYSTPLSGHCHKVEQFLLFLDLPYEIIHAPSEIRTTEMFRHLNPLQQIPILIDDQKTITDSNAILIYLAKQYAPNSHWLPEDPMGAADIQRWLSIAAGEIKYGCAIARAVKQWDYQENLEHAQTIAKRILAFMEQHLQQREWLATKNITIADLSCYAYIAHIPEGGISLAPYPAICQWLKRIEILPKFKAMPKLQHYIDDDTI